MNVILQDVLQMVSCVNINQTQQFRLAKSVYTANLPYHHKNRKRQSKSRSYLCPLACQNTDEISETKRKMGWGISRHKTSEKIAVTVNISNCLSVCFPEQMEPP